MQKLLDGMTLYHGSYCEISSPDLGKCAPYKDFGKGFYLTSSYEQAKSFINTALKKAKSQNVIDESQNFGVISTFKYHADSSLQIKTFEDADAQWLHCIVAHRKDKSFPDVIEELEKYDIVVGKIADDATNFTLIAYIAGTYGDVGSKEADDLCISRLLPDRLEGQYCFRTADSLACLEYVGSEAICRS